jgi:hypothetical protein
MEGQAGGRQQFLINDGDHRAVAMTQVMEDIGEGPWKFGDPVPGYVERYEGSGTLDLRKAAKIALTRGAEDFQWALDSERAVRVR